jgi:translation initiation factor 4G
VILKKANLALNQLSVEKFDKLSDRFMSCGIDRSEELINKAAHMIIMKAQLEEHFCFMYADLCRKIVNEWDIRDAAGTDAAAAVSSEDAAADGAPPARPLVIEGGLGKYFRAVLLVKCEEEFHLDRVAGVAELMALDIPQDEKEEKVFVYRKRYLGHMRFVGEVFLQDLVKYGIMITCVQTLCQSFEEDSLACMCKLMTTIGRKLEDLAATRSKVRDPLEQLFQDLARMSADTEKYSSRMR